MLRTLLVLAAVVVAPSLAVAQSKTEATTKQIEAMERAINAAIQKGDVAAFKANIADDAITVDAMGPSSVTEFMKMFSQVKLTKFSIDKVKVQFLNDTTAVISYLFTGEGSMMGQPMPSPTWSSTVWVNRAGKWQAVFHQESLALPPAKK